MSYAANPSRIRSATVRNSTSRQGGRGAPDSAPARRPPKGKSYEESRDWGKILLLGATVAAGAALGAGAALLITEQTGSERRSGIARGARRFGHRAERAWDDLAFELREAARAGRNRLRRRRPLAHDARDDDDDED
jgi:hypothetical protein